MFTLVPTMEPYSRYSVFALRYFPLIAMMSLWGCGPQHVGDLVVINANVWTGDESQPAATAFAARNGKFVYVGTDEQQARQSVTADASVLDAKGARILPGLIDAHLHLVSGGLQLSRLNLRDVPDRAAFIAAVAERARRTPKGEWILGGRWSTESWPDPAQPTKDWIDAATPNHPVLLSRMDGHGALANSVALKIANIDANGPPDPPGGQIERDPKTHEPTGILKDAAIDLVEKLFPPLSPRESRQALIAAMKEAHRHGLTSVHTMSDWRDIETMRESRDLKILTLRVRVFVQEDDWPRFIKHGKGFPSDDDLRILGFKQYADGSLGSRTAYMANPFADNSLEKANWRGLPREIMSNPARLYQFCLAIWPMTPAVHAIGDQANHDVLNVYEERANENALCQTAPRQRFRIEHAQHLLPTDIPRFAKLGVVASMQPLHKADDARYAEKAIGPERCKTSYAFRSLLDAGAHVAFGSDWPVVSLNPFLGIHAAVTGESLDGKVFVPEQNITVEEALRCYTSGAAYAAGDDDRLGKIKEGYLADFVILDRDVLTIPASELKSIEVKETYLSGRCVFTSASR